MEKSSSLPTLNVPIIKFDVQPLPRLLKKSTNDEKKNLSKHHLILPNNTQICVETLLSQCISEEQTDRKLDTKLRARLKRKKVALFKPKNFILRNERLRPIVTTNAKSGVFRSVSFVEYTSQKKRNYLTPVPANVLYTQSSLPSRIQSVKDFCNNKWIVERMAQYMANDWTMPLTLSGNVNKESDNLDAATAKEMRPKDWPYRNDLKGVRSRNEWVVKYLFVYLFGIFSLLNLSLSSIFRNDNIDQIKRPTIHRLVTPEGFQLSSSAESFPRFGSTHIAVNKVFKQPLQQSFNSESTNSCRNDKLNSLGVTPVSRTRFSRATQRSPRSSLKYDMEFDALPMMDCQQDNVGDETIENGFTAKGAALKNSFGNKNRCGTCNKVCKPIVFYIHQHLLESRY